MSDRAMIRAIMQGLVDRAGGVEPAAALIGARLGSDVSKGSISKRNAGHLDWPLVDIMALEDAIGDHPVQRWLRNKSTQAAQKQSLIEATADLVREGGEAGSAVLDLLAGRGSPEDALKEAMESLTANKRIVALLEAQNAIS